MAGENMKKKYDVFIAYHGMIMIYLVRFIIGYNMKSKGLRLGKKFRL